MMNSKSHNQRLMSEAREVREYTDKQENRCKGLLNRLSRLQIDLLQSHTEEQLKSVVKQSAKKLASRQGTRKLSGSAPASRWDHSVGGRTHSGDSGLSSPSSSAYNFNNLNGDGLPGVIVKPKKRRNSSHDMPLWKMPDITDMQYVNASFQSVLRQTTVGNLDLDETESSSGDSSCDETMFIHEDADGTTKRVTHYLPVEDNPTYKFAQERAKIIAVWTWLQDAISNLSYKIKQQDEFAKHLMMAKPPFQFDEHGSHHRQSHTRPPSNAALKDASIQIFTANNNSQIPPTSTQVFYAGERKDHKGYITDPAGKVIQLIPPPTSSSSTSVQKLPNGDTKSSSQLSAQEMQSNSIVGGGLESLGLTIQVNHDPSCTARRCLPLKPFKQRKIYQLGGIHNMSSFAGRAPTLLCTCFGRTELCAVCSGRARKTKLIDVEVMDQKEVHELLDHNYHRTLSLPDETPIATLIESALKREGWTGQPPKQKTKFKRLNLGWQRPRSQWVRSSQSDAFGLKKRGRGRPRLPRGIDQFGHVVIKHPKPTLVIDPPPAVTVIRKRPNWRKDPRRNPISRRASYGGDIRRAIKIRRKKFNSISLGSRRRERDSGISDEESLYDADFQNYEDFINDGSQGNKADKRLTQSGRKLNQDYDIDNIVIPYSIASSTRVEKIEYKEILTPSWRVVSDFNPEKVPGQEESLSSDGETEAQTDLNEEVIKIRHDRCEVDEHKRFHSVPEKLSSRRTRRLDSRTEPLELDHSFSAAEDFLGPDSQDSAKGPVSPVMPTTVDVDDPMTGDSHSGATQFRRRTISSTSTEQEEQKMEIDYGPRAIPFEPRQFPLTDDEYVSMSREMPLIEEDEIKVEGRSFSPTTVHTLSDFDGIGGSKSSRPRRESKSFHVKRLMAMDTDEVKDEDLELLDLGEESEADEDDPDWQRAPGERAV